MALIIMAVEIDGKVIEHEKPTKRSELIFEYKCKFEQLKTLQREVDELDAIIKAIDGPSGCQHFRHKGTCCNKCGHDLSVVGVSYKLTQDDIPARRI